MGLDMYLTARKTVKDISPDALEDIIGTACKYNYSKLLIELEVGYWRKCHAIHDWFVEAVQDGSDNCGEYWVEETLLHTLYESCWAVKIGEIRFDDVFDDSDLVRDQYEQIDLTIEILENVLTLGFEWDLYYSSSW